MLNLGIITLMPQMFESLYYGITGRAIDNNIITVNCWNQRDWGIGSYKKVDDKPYGGGPGMVLMYEPMRDAIMHAKTQMPKNCKTVYLSPQGKDIKQHDLQKIATDNQSILFIAGRYEGIDERIIDKYVDEEWSIGDYVLSGGELAAMVFIEAITRLLPGSLGNSASFAEDSFADGVLDYPNYTRPAITDDISVPQVLLNGNHHEISRWRRKMSLGKTWLKRPDLLKKIQLTNLDEHLLSEFKSDVIRSN